MPKAALPALIVILATLVYAAGFTAIYNRTTSREAASRWIYANVPPGSTIANEHWDDGLPVPLPGSDLGQFQSIQFEHFFPDNREKTEVLLQRLGEADYIVLSSNRLYGTIPRAGERYPMAELYYEMLFNGELGFDLVHTETSYPSFLGIELVDDGAEEAFTVYDHPKVLIFAKAGRFDPAVVSARLLATVEDPVFAYPPNKVGNNLLLMDDSTRAGQLNAGTWSAMFDPEGWTNRFAVIVWYLALQMMALAAVPIVWRIFPGLPDGGWAVAKTIGVLGASYVAWLLGSIRFVRFGPDAVLMGVIAVLMLGLWTVRDRIPVMLGSLHARLRAIIAAELVFSITFIFAVLMRAQNPDLWHRFRGGEKPMDFAFFNAVIKSSWFPAYDPWFAGGYLHYYYFGFVQWGAVTRLTGIVPEVAYNLAVASVFALICVNVWSVAVTVLARLTDSPGGRGPSWRVLGVGLLAPLLVGIAGNLDLTRRIGRGEFGYPAEGFWTALPGFAALDEILHGIWNGILRRPEVPSDIYWSATRVIPGTINEFPYFSFLFGDLHAHYMALPIATAALLLAYQIASGPAIGGPLLRSEPVIIVTPLTDHVRWVRHWLANQVDWGLTGSAVAAGFLTGALYATNTWDYPTYLALLTGSFVLREGVRLGWQVGWPATVRVGLWVGLAIVSERILFMPFHLNFSGDSGLVSTPDRTTVPEFLTIHGVLLVAVAGFLMIEIARTDRRGTVPVPMPTFSVHSDHVRSEIGRVPVPRGLALAALPALLIAIGLLAGVLTLALVGMLALCGVALWLRSDSAIRLAVILSIACATGLSLFVERYALEGDIGRMNTVFKLYLQIWVLFGTAAAIGIGAVVLSRPARGRGSNAWLAICAVLILGGLIYPLAVTQARVADRFAPLDPTLDGMAYMGQAVYGDEPTPGAPIEFALAGDLMAIDWLRLNITGSPVVLEATIPGYRWGSRVSVYTGLPTVLGWDWHETQQRRGFGEMINQRRADVTAMFDAEMSFPDLSVLLDRYDVRLIYIGDLERAYYSEAGLTKFADAAAAGQLSVLYQSPAVTIYGYNGRVLQDG